MSAPAFASIYSHLPFDSNWQMEPAERLALVALARHLRPKASLEIGTKHGGSLAVLSEYSEKVFSLDLDPTVATRLSHLPNVEFVTGDSRATLPKLLARLRSEGVPLELALVDGDHSREGARADCETLASSRPLATLFVLVHDSFNPDVRRGILEVGWESSPFVHALELDAVPGRLMSNGRMKREMWGGFALAVLEPEPRVGPLAIGCAAELSFESLRRRSVHSLPVRALVRLQKMLAPPSAP